MADETHVTEKVYCYDHPSAYKQDNSAIWAAMANKDSGNEWMYANQMNNPMWLVWMMAMRWMYGNEGMNGNGYAALQNQISDNQNFNSVLNNLTQNQNAMQNIADRTNTNIDFVRQSLCNLGSAVQNVAGKTELSAERVINAINMGDANIVSQMLQCCCQNKQLVQQMGYEGQIRDLQNTAAINSNIEGTRQALVNGFSQVGYATQQQTCDIITAGNANTQRIIDVMNNHWQSELQQKYQDARLELSQQAQNAYLISQLKTTA